MNLYIVIYMIARFVFYFNKKNNYQLLKWLKHFHFSSSIHKKVVEIGLGTLYSGNEALPELRHGFECAWLFHF